MGHSMVRPVYPLYLSAVFLQVATGSASGRSIGIVVRDTFPYAGERLAAVGVEALHLPHQAASAGSAASHTILPNQNISASVDSKVSFL